MSFYAQNFGLSGIILDENKQPISYANIVLYNTNDAFVKGTSSEDDGSFEIGSINEGDYVLKVSFIGYKTFTKDLKISKDLKLEPITLIEDSEALDQVTVTAKRPKITRKPDRLTFNIANTALTEGTTLQVLKSTPGVIVSEGSININRCCGF